MKRSTWATVSRRLRLLGGALHHHGAHRPRLAAGLVASALLGGALAGYAAPVASARTLSLNESGQLRLTSKKGFTLNERGSTKGTIAGMIYIHLHLVSQSRVTAEVNIYPSGGSLSGSGSASYRVEGAVARFSGTLSITRGSGTYARARASGLRFNGTIRRRDDAVAVTLSGPLSY